MERGADAGEPRDVLATRDAGPLAIRGGMLRIGGYALGLLFALASIPLLTRHLGVADFGGYVTVLSLITIVGLISDAGLTIVGVREYAVREPGDRRRLVTNLLGLRIAVTAAGVAVATAFAVAAGYDEALIAGTVLAGAGLVLLVAQQAYAVPLSAELRLGLVTGLDLLRQGLLAVGIVVLVAAGAGLAGFFAVPLPVGVVVAALTLLAIRGRRFGTPAFEAAEWRYLTREAIPVALASTVGSFFYRVAIIMMSLIATAQQTGYFSASFRVVEAIVMVPGLITASAFPILARAATGDEDRLAYALGRLFEIGVILGAWMALCLVIGAEPIMQLVGGSEFDPAVPVLRIQGAAVALSFLVAVWATGLWALKRQRALLWANVAGVAVAAGLTALLIPPAGAEGAAIAMTAAELLLAGCYAYALMRDRPKLRPPLAVVPKTLVASALAGALWFVPAPDALLVLAATAVFFAALAALRGLPPDVWAALSGRMRASRA